MYAKKIEVTCGIFHDVPRKPSSGQHHQCEGRLGVIPAIIRDRSKIRGGGGLVETWGGPWFFMQAQKGGSNNLVHVIKGGPLFFMQRCWGQGVNLQFLCSHSHSSVNIIWNTFFI